MTPEIKNSFCPTSKQEWRSWLEENHLIKENIWLIIYKKNTNIPSISWSDAVDEALCFGWIDSIRKTLNEEKYIQFFSKRKSKSTWSKINKDKVLILIENGSMKNAGLKSIEVAKKNGSWFILDDVEALIIPEELNDKFQEFEGSKEYFNGLSISVKKGLLYWIAMAKKTETKEKRIFEIVEKASNNQLPKVFR